MRCESSQLATRRISRRWWIAAGRQRGGERYEGEKGEGKGGGALSRNIQRPERHHGAARPVIKPRPLYLVEYMPHFFLVGEPSPCAKGAADILTSFVTGESGVDVTGLVSPVSGASPALNSLVRCRLKFGLD